MLNQLPSIIQEAEKEYENLNWFEKLLTPKTEYVDTAVQEWQDNVVAPMESEIQKSFGEMNIVSDTWASDAATTMVEALESELDPNTLCWVLDDDWQAVLEGMLKDVNGMLDMDVWAGDMVHGYADGIENSSADCRVPIETWAEKMLQWFHDSKLEFGSPSKAMETYGEDTVKGFTNGLSSDASNALLSSSVSSFANKIISYFNEKIQVFKEIGEFIAKGIADGMSSNLSLVGNSAVDLAKIIKEKIEEELDIASPSKVMYKLGEYTTEGFKLGMESLFGETEKAMTSFTGEIAKAPKMSYSVPTVSAQGIKQSDITSSLYPLIYNAVSSAMENGNTNVNVILEGDTDKIFKVVQNKSQMYTRRTGLPAFS